MDRIHRLGQHRPVQAIKLVIEDSIESRIIQVGTNFIQTCCDMLSAVSTATREEVGYGRCYALYR